MDSKNDATNPPVWNSWDIQLPKSGNDQKDFAEYKFLNDFERIRNLHKELRTNVITAIKKECKDLEHTAIVIAGGESADFNLYDSDTGKCEFRQEAYFRYLFGINEPDCLGVIDLGKEEAVLLVPEVSDDSQRWNGTRLPLEHYTERHGVDETRLTTDLYKVLQQRGFKKLMLLYGENTDSGSYTTTAVKLAEMDTFEVDKTSLHPIMTELRVIKTKQEIEMMRMGNLVSCKAHAYVMKHIRPGMTEMQLEALFKGWCLYYAGARHTAYTCICGSGDHGSILHYGHAGRPNSRMLLDGDRVVLDMGAEYNGYATDITRSYPVNGVYTPDQRAIHTAVKDSMQTVFEACKPGVTWVDMHLLSEKVLLEHLLTIGILHNGTLDDMIACNIACVFMPHGLGHLMGMNVHDVGGFTPSSPPRQTTLGVSYLRTCRVLKAGMVLTIEPGLYFVEPIIKKALANEAQAKYINTEVLQRFRNTGGCRLEDDVLITETGCDNLTTLPSSCDEIEALMARSR